VKETRLGAPVQIAYAVADARSAAELWVSRFGAGPFFVRSHIPVSDVVYRSQPSAFDHTSAYGQWGSIMVELVQDHGSGPSIVRERYAPHESGLHHLAYIVADLDAVTRRLIDDGYPLAMTARTSNTGFNFIDCVATLGHMIELYEESERITAFYGMVRSAAAGWDGADPVREL